VLFSSPLLKTSHSRKYNDQLFVVTIGDEHANCRPRIADPSCGDCEWCVEPVNGVRHQRKCGFNDWQELLKHLKSSELPQRHKEEFMEYGRIGVQQKLSSMCGNLLVHLRALESMCQAVDQRGKKDPGFGISLESDIDPSWNPYTFPRSHLIDIMRHHSSATTFNLGTTTPICSDGQQHRLEAFISGTCFTKHEFGTWGTTAVGFNLTTACSKDFFSAQEALVGCVPSDVALYSGSKGFEALDASIPFFRVFHDMSTSNSGDPVHKELKNTYVFAEKAWSANNILRVDCLSGGKPAQRSFFSAMNLDCHQ